MHYYVNIRRIAAMMQSQRNLLSRRQMLQIAGAVVTGSSSQGLGQTRSRQTKKVIVLGGGIAGLSCGYELMKRGHEVMVLEATGRSGGHVKTIREPFADGLYADGGAEHITRPGYDRFWAYVDEFDLEVCRCLQRDDVRRLIGGKWYTEEMLRDRQVLSGFGFNQKEIDFLSQNPWSELAMLYYVPFLDSFEDEYKPFEAGLTHLDQISMAELLQEEGASEAAIRRLGGSSSALHNIWHAAILKLRGVPLYPTEVFRLMGGNQTMTDTLAERLDSRLWLGCPVSGVRQGESGVTVSYSEFGREEKEVEADFAVSCVNLSQLQNISVTPAWPQEKAYAIRYLPYYSNTRVMFQSRTRFWETDRTSPNLSLGQPALSSIWQMAAEVETERGLLEGAAPGVVSAEDALAAFRAYYPGQSEDIEQAYVVNWPVHPWAAQCETVAYQPGELPKIWPTIVQSFGRIHFAGAYADNLNWGMEAATRSAYRVAEGISRL